MLLFQTKYGVDMHNNIALIIISDSVSLQVCTTDGDCGRAICLGIFVHPTELSYPFDVQLNNTCGKTIVL